MVLALKGFIITSLRDKIKSPVIMKSRNFEKEETEMYGAAESREGWP